MKQIFTSALMICLLSIPGKSTFITRARGIIALSGVSIQSPITDRISYSAYRSVGMITICNNTSEQNVLDLPMIKQINRFLTVAEHDRHIDAIWIDSLSSKLSSLENYFCKGLDMSVLGHYFAQASELLLQKYLLTHRIRYMKKPVIAFAEARCEGAGLELFGAAHHRIATQRAGFAVPGVSQGLSPDDSIHTILGDNPCDARIRLVQQMVCTAARMPARQAKRDLGLVQHIYHGSRYDFADSLSHYSSTKRFGIFYYRPGVTHSLVRKSILSAISKAEKRFPPVEEVHPTDYLHPWDLPIEASQQAFLRKVNEGDIQVSQIAALVSRLQCLEVRDLMRHGSDIKTVCDIKAYSYSVFLNMLRGDDFFRCIKEDYPRWGTAIDPENVIEMERANWIAISKLYLNPRHIELIQRLKDGLLAISSGFPAPMT